MNEVSKFSFTAHNPPSVITCANWIVTLSSDVSQHDTIPGVSIFNEMFTTSLVAAVHKVRVTTNVSSILGLCITR